ncbi:MAG TPA: thioredoxin domain-containing protein [Gemmatimonadaceae bacterium]|nr:thioredoxin domain-containing protein [Gemmatimonadaceae bacterium]
MRGRLHDAHSARLPAGRPRGSSVRPLRQLRGALLVALALAVSASANTLSAQLKPRTAEDDVPALSKAGESRAVGADSAKVIILEFLDYACPVCATFHTARADSLRKALPADVRIVYVNFPLQQHMRSFQGSEAAMCAGAVGGKTAYLAMADQLYRKQSEWSNAADPGINFSAYAMNIKIDPVAFADCRSRDEMAPLVLADLETAGKFDIQGTPTFVMLPRGAQSAEDTERTSGNATIAQLLELVTKARTRAK